MPILIVQWAGSRKRKRKAARKKAKRKRNNAVYKSSSMYKVLNCLFSVISGIIVFPRSLIGVLQLINED